MNRKIHPNEYVQIVNLYVQDRVSSEKIAKDYRVSGGAITRILKQAGIELNPYRNRKYYFNETYFGQIDTEDKAYFLGLLYSDGYVSSTGGKYGVILQLQDTDIDILKKFSDTIGYTGELLKIQKKKPHHKFRYRIELYSKIMVMDLLKWGCFQKKSLTLKFPAFLTTSPEMMRHFLRGVFDGDGSIHVDKAGKLIAGITGSPFFIDGLLEYLESWFGFVFAKIHYKKSLAKGMRCNARKAMMFLDWIFVDSNVYMKRKITKYFSFMRAYVAKTGCSSGGSKIDVKALLDKDYRECSIA